MERVYSASNGSIFHITVMMSKLGNRNVVLGLCVGFGAAWVAKKVWNYFTENKRYQYSNDMITLHGPAGVYMSCKPPYRGELLVLLRAMPSGLCRIGSPTNLGLFY